MFLGLTVAVIVIVFALVLREDKKRRESMREIEASVIRIEKLAMEHQRLADEIIKK